MLPCLVKCRLPILQKTDGQEEDLPMGCVYSSKLQVLLAILSSFCKPSTISSVATNAALAANFVQSLHETSG